MYSNQYMNVNTKIASNSFVPVPIDSIGVDNDALYSGVNLLDERNFLDLNSPVRMNYSSFNQNENPQNNLWSDKASVMQNITSQSGVYNDYENPFRINTNALKEFNNYSKPLTYAMTSVLDLWGEDEKDPNAGTGATAYTRANVVFIHNVVVRSLFNPYLAINVRGMQTNLPLLNDKNASKTSTGYFPVDVKSKIDDFDPNKSSYLADVLNKVPANVYDYRYKNKDEFDTSDCTIKTLVKLSKESKNKDGSQKYSKLGRSIYKYADFMFCKDLGKVSNNYLITLRKFPHPIGDNIFTLFGNEDNDGDLNIAPDIGRMVCWLGDDNKLEDILKFSFNDSFKEFESDFYEAESKEGDESRGVIGTITNLANPGYRQGVMNGKWGGENSILNEIGGWTSFSDFGGKKVLNPQGTYEGDADAQDILFGRRWDQNKIYYPKGTIRDTHQYEGRLTFQHEFSLTFDYELRAYANINPKSAFLDLLGNILKVTYRTGTFWGGEQRVYGIPANKAGWKKAIGIVDNALDKTKETTHQLLLGTIDLKSILGTMGNSIKGVVNSFQNADWSEIKAQADKVITGDGGALDVLGGMFKNFAGRPAIYALNSILNGEPVGLWHVTIGNPRNPIMSIGNLIVTNTSVQQYGPLGIDDFPTGIKVVVNLKHGRSRDATEIANMYTMGIGAIHIVPKAGLPSMYYNSDEMFDTFGTTNKSIIEKSYSN